MSSIVLFAACAPVPPGPGTPSSGPSSETAPASSTVPTGTVPETTPSSSAATGDTGGASTAAGPAWPVEDTVLYLNIGDSLAAGYDAAGEYGYARLLHANDDVLAPGFAGHDLVTLSGAALVSITESGANSAQVLSNLRGAALPPADGPVVATISVGGNDFNDNVEVMLAEPLTRVVADDLRANLGEMVAELHDRYDEVYVWFLNIQDPTDGTGTLPPQYDQDFCGVIQAVPALLAGVGVANLQIVNDAIADEAAEQGAGLVDYHGAFLGHGLTTNDGWMSGDCAHPTTLGHHELRSVIWEEWTGEAL